MINIRSERDPETLRQVAQLQDREIARLIKDNAHLRTELARLQGQTPGGVQQELDLVKELLAQREQELYGRSSEKRPIPDTKEGSAPREATQPRRGHGPRPQPNLPMVEEVRSLAEESRECPACGGHVTEMTGQTEDSEEITVIERQFVLKTIKRRKYRCQCNGAVVTAPASPKLIPGGRYTPEVAVHVAIAKYADHLPLERQVTAMARVGLEVCSQTLWDQISALAGALTPSYEALRERALQAEVVGGDETRWPLLAGGTSSHYAWSLTTPEVAFYRISEGRSTKEARALLGTYKGVVMADGYSVYASLAREAGFELVHCWAHVRRKLLEAQANAAQASHALDLIGQLYAVEREVPDLSPRASPEDHAAARALRQKLREERSRPIIATLRDWAYEVLPPLLPECGLAKAVTYMLKLWPGLTRFLVDPRVGLDNNATERSLRGLVVGRKNHYGSRSLRGCEVAAIFYTLVESAKLVGVNPQAYLLRATYAALANPGTVTLPADLLA